MIIDEVQRIPDLLNEVHRLIEKKNIRFVLTGSSARSLRKRGVNLLAGRALTRHFHPLTVQELGDDFNLTNSLQYGHLPYVFQAQNKTDYLASYIQTYLREEVLQEGLTRSLSSFTRFLEVASFSQAGLVNASEIAREIGVDRKTVENYFQITEDLLIGHRLPSFTKRSRRRLVAGNKFFFFDCGVFRALRPVEVKQKALAEKDWLVETFVEEGASIGANSTLLPGIRLGRYCMVGVGSVVTKDVEPYTLVVGNPARVIGRVDEEGERVVSPARVLA